MWMEAFFSAYTCSLSINLLNPDETDWNTLAMQYVFTPVVRVDRAEDSLHDLNISPIDA